MVIRTVAILIFMLGFGMTSFSQETKTKHIVEIKNMKFIPATLHVKKGDTVVWINRDIFPHNVAKFEDKSWQSPILEKGQSWSKVVAKNEHYFCSLHVVMKGELIIK